MARKYTPPFFVADQVQTLAVTTSGVEGSLKRKFQIDNISHLTACNRDLLLKGSQFNHGVVSFPVGAELNFNTVRMT
jgi:hypothetical protein